MTAFANDRMEETSVLPKDFRHDGLETGPGISFRNVLSSTGPRLGMEQGAEWGPMIRVTPYCAKSPTYGGDHVLPSPSPVEARSRLQGLPGTGLQDSRRVGTGSRPQGDRRQPAWQALRPAVPAGPGAPIRFARSLRSWAHVLILGRLRSRFRQAAGAQMAWDRLAVTTFRES